MIARGDEPTDFELNKDDWYAVVPTDWPALKQRFLASIDELLTLCDDKLAMGRVVFGDRDVGCMLVSHTTHNAYHLGQIVMLRRLMGNWPGV